MLAIDGGFLDFRRLDLLAMGESSLHRLDPRAKVLTTLVFILCVVSFDRYAVSALLPFLVFPTIMLTVGNLPVGYILRKILVVVPFALLVGLFNPLFDRQVVWQLGTLELAGGWVSCLSILMRAVLAASAAITLVAVTGFPALCGALEKLGMPQVFAVQLQFLYRYIFILTDEGARTARARQLRDFGRRPGLRQFGSLAGHLLLRTWERAERIHAAMLARGFTGVVRTARRNRRFGRAELFFMTGWCGLFILLRLFNAPQLLGGLITGAMP